MSLKSLDKIKGDIKREPTNNTHPERIVTSKQLCQRILESNKLSKVLIAILRDK